MQYGSDENYQMTHISISHFVGTFISEVQAIHLCFFARGANNQKRMQAPWKNQDKQT